MTLSIRFLFTSFQYSKVISSHPSNVLNIIPIPEQLSRKPVFVSFSTEAEDVVLYHIFRDTSVGFYIDVGANHPTYWSDTKIFYENGWSGINIEPLQEHCQSLRRERKRDINLCVAAGEAKGEMTLFQHDDLSTLKKNVAELAEIQRKEKFPGIKVPVMTLAEICSLYCANRTVINFMKIDVEGFEYNVLKGMDFTKWKPQVLQLEASEPFTARPTYPDFEPLLKQFGYEFVYSHWLDRWYIHKDYPHLKRNFKTLEEIQKYFKIVRFP